MVDVREARPGPEKEDGKVLTYPLGRSVGRTHEALLGRKDSAFSGTGHQPEREGTQTLMSLTPSRGEMTLSIVLCGPCAHRLTVQGGRQTTKQTGCSAREGN